MKGFYLNCSFLGYVFLYACLIYVLQPLNWLRGKSWCRSVNSVHEEWFADEDQVRKAVGLLEKPVVDFSNSKEVTIYCTGIYSQ